MTTPAPAQQTNQPTASSVIALAESQIGQYSSVNKFNSWYGMPGSEWCDEFVSWVFNHAGAGPAIGGKFALTSAHAAWFKSKGKWSTSNPQSGDLVFFDWSGGKSMTGIHHVGIVKGVSGSNVNTVEGNTGNNQVANRTRSPQFIVGFGTPDIAGLGAASPTSANPAGFTNPLGDLTGVFTGIENVAKHLVDPGFWKRAGLFGLAAVLIAFAVAFLNRKKLETAGKAAAVGAVL